MKRKLMDEWLDSLKDGEFEQYDGGLRSNDEDVPKYCCLGVLAQIQWSSKPEQTRHTKDKFAIFEDLMTVNYIESDYVRDLNMQTLDMDVQKVLASINDLGFDFPFIARFIERHLFKDDDARNVRFDYEMMSGDVGEITKYVNSCQRKGDTIRQSIAKTEELWNTSSLPFSS
jgi:hypothetical protein